MATEQELRDLFLEAEKRGDRETQEKIIVRLEEMQAAPETAAPAQDTMLSRMEEDVVARQDKVSEEFGKFVQKPSKMAAFDFIGDLTGQSAGATLDVIGEGIVTGLKALKDAAPEEVQRFVGEGFKTFINAVPEEIKLGLSSGTGDVIDKYQDLEEKHPEVMQQVANMTNILALAAPAPKANPAARPNTFIGKKGTNLVRKAKVQTGREKRDAILDLIRPDKFPERTTSKSPKLVIDAIADTRRTKEAGILRSKVKAPTAFETKVARDVSKVPGINVSRSELHVANKVNDHIKNLSNKLDDDLIKLPPPRTSLARNGIRAIDTEVDSFMSGQVFLSEQRAQVEAIKQKAKSLLLAADDTAHGVRRARIAFDEWANKLEIPLDMEKAIGAVNTKIRDTMNGIVNTEAKKHGINASRVQSNIHHLIEANKVLSPKAEKLGANAIVRLGHNVRQVVGARNAAMSIVATALGTTVIGAAQVAAAPVGASVAAGITTAVLFKGIRSPAVKRGVGALLKATDDALKISTDPVMIQQLRADRALMVELFEHLEKLENEGQ